MFLDVEVENRWGMEVFAGFTVTFGLIHVAAVVRHQKLPGTNTGYKHEHERVVLC